MDSPAPVAVRVEPSCQTSVLFLGSVLTTIPAHADLQQPQLATTLQNHIDSLARAEHTGCIANAKVTRYLQAEPCQAVTLLGCIPPCLVEERNGTDVVAVIRLTSGPWTQLRAVLFDSSRQVLADCEQPVQAGVTAFR